MPIAERPPWMTRKRALVGLGVATVRFMALLYLLDPHTQGHGGTGVGGFDFAASSARAARILAERGPKGGAWPASPCCSTAAT